MAAEVGGCGQITIRSQLQPHGNYNWLAASRPPNTPRSLPDPPVSSAHLKISSVNSMPTNSLVSFAVAIPAKMRALRVCACRDGEKICCVTLLFRPLSPAWRQQIAGRLDIYSLYARQCALPHEIISSTPCTTHTTHCSSFVSPIHN